MTLPIVTPRLVLRRYTREDQADLLVLAAQAEVAKVLCGRLPATQEGVRSYIDLQNSYRPFEQDQVFELAVARREDGRVIGLVGLIRRDQGQGEIGWALAAEYRGQGYATEAAGALMAYGFTALDLHRIHADTNSDNGASRRIMERLGMKQEAQLREVAHEDGHWLDRCIYGILAGEWGESGAADSAVPSRGS